MAETWSFVDNEGVLDPVLTSNIASNTPKGLLQRAFESPGAERLAAPWAWKLSGCTVSRAIPRQYGVRGVCQRAASMLQGHCAGPDKAFQHGQTEPFDRLEGADDHFCSCSRPQKAL